MNYQEALAYIDSYTDYEKTPVPHAAANYDLRRLEELMAYFDNPHLKTKSVHITGTKGKGSTAAMIASILATAGYTTGLYTSPHLLTIRERVQINGRMISEAEFVEIIERLQPKIEEVNRRATYGVITTFELLTALAFLYFAGKNVDFQVLEVGMGGTYDATNIIKSPEVCVITSISLDHTEVLGNTLAAIAGEKSGIIKPGAVVVISPQKEEAARVIEEICSSRRAKLIEVGREITWRGMDFNINAQEFLVDGRRGSYNLTIPLLGEHQLVNASTALAAIEVLQERGCTITKDNIAAGFAGVNWPGRFQIIGRRPLIVVDGAHNPDSARKLRETIEQYLQFKNATLVIGVSSDKDITGMVAELAPVAGRAVATRARHPRAMVPERIAAEFSRYNIPVEIEPDVNTAMSRAVALAGDKGMVCITGSLFVVAETLETADRFGKC